MAVIDSKFSNFDDGGNLVVTDIVVGLRNGVNTRFTYTGGVGVYLPLAGGTMAGTINMNNNSITTLPPPSAGGDATNKTYVDNAISTALGSYLPLAGGTMSGAIAMGTNKITGLGTPTLSTDAATKAYADLMLPLTGGTMLGNINMGGFKATNAADPTNPQDYATKFYVDQNSKVGTQVYAATTATLNATQSGAGVGATLTDASGTFAAFSVDGVSPPLNSEILNKNQTNAAHQGIYTLTQNGDGISIPWVLTRSINYDVPAQINNTGLINVNNGSTLAGTAWYNTATIVTVDTTNFSYSQFGASFLSSSLASGKIFRGNGSNLAVASTSSFADTYGASELLYSSGANNVVGLTTGNNMVLSTNGSGVPAWSTTLPSGLTIPGYAASGANGDITSMTGLTGGLRAPTFILDSNGNEVLGFTGVASAVNYIALSNAATGGTPGWTALGADPNISMGFSCAGTGVFQFFATATAPTQLNWYEQTTNGSNTISVTAPASIASNQQVTWKSASSGYPALDSTDSDAWTDFSGSVGFTGFSANPTGIVARYKKIGKTCFVSILMVAGTSNATDFTITGLPFTSAAFQHQFPWATATQASTAATTNNIAGVIQASTTAIICTFNGSATGWSNSGTKAVNGVFFYETA